ncbi:MAG: PH domain-containing protein, partial [Rhodobacteraceae bacterium]|nr:PH domain-containing protein [Paracoccaceae bacterium]
MHDDFAMEPIQGLPGNLPAGERILWQGRPDWWALAKSALAFQWVCGYFLLLAGWQLLLAVDHTPFPQAIPTTFPVLFFGFV